MAKVNPPKNIALGKYLDARVLELYYYGSLDMPCNFLIRVRLDGAKRAGKIELADILEDLDVAPKASKLELRGKLQATFEECKVVFIEAYLAGLCKIRNTYVFTVKPYKSAPPPHEPF